MPPLVKLPRPIVGACTGFHPNNTGGELGDRLQSLVASHALLHHHHTDGQLYTRRGGRGFYFEDPNGHLLEVMTVPETGS